MKRSAGTSIGTVRHLTAPTQPAGHKAPQEAPPSVPAKPAPHEPTNDHQDAFAQDAVPPWPVPRSVERLLAALEQPGHPVPGTLQQPAPHPMPDDRGDSDGDEASSSSDGDRFVPVALRPVEQDLAQLVGFARTMAPEYARQSVAMGLWDLLDNDRVRTPEHWQAIRPHLSPAVLAAYPSLRATLAAQLLKSPGASPALVTDIATLCLDADPDTPQLLAVWTRFSLAIQSGDMALATAQSLLDSLVASQQKQPPAARWQFERAQASLALQRQQAH